MPSKSFADILELHSKETIALTGSGGKTHLMFQLARELQRSGKKVITTTTTRIWYPSEEQSPYVVTLDRAPADLEAFLQGLLARYGHISLGLCEKEGKLQGVPPPTMAALAALPGLDALISEADGSRGKSLKGYRDHEPVLSGIETTVLVVMALDVLGREVSHRTVHRPEIVRSLASGSSCIDLPLLGRLLLGNGGYLERASQGKRVLILNKISTRQELAGAEALREEVRSLRPPVAVFFRGPLFGSDPPGGSWCFMNPDGREQASNGTKEQPYLGDPSCRRREQADGQTQAACPHRGKAHGFPGPHKV
ncbi:MAG: selenium cofactor biosynthesis protein YqeC [Candidatus Eremiobacteraeota bacterium]|nr:selenium cofactor biosynthesis protein YqeC [Candidatus Eremiobacteraeota bacterium]